MKVLNFLIQDKDQISSYEIDLKACHLKHPLTLKDVIEDGREKKLLKEADWLIKLELDDVKEMFDPFITKIIYLIRGQLDQLRNK